MKLNHSPEWELNPPLSVLKTDTVPLHYNKKNILYNLENTIKILKKCFKQLKSCLPDATSIKEYSSLFNGDTLHHIYLQIDPEPSFHITKLTGLEDQALLLGRVKNFDAIVKNVKALYDEELGMTLLVVPESICLGKAPESREGLENMKLLSLLLLGAAVQCPNKEIFITRIKELDVDLQHNIVECIKQVCLLIFLFISFI